MKDKIYPDHIYDPMRLKMAAEYTQKELRKLFPSMPSNLWFKLDKDVVDWFEGQRSNLAAVHDFWNGCEGITQGFKLKRVIRYISAQNIAWSLEEIDINTVPLGWSVGTLKEKLGSPPYQAPQIREALERDRDFFKQNLSLSEHYAKPSRDHYPVFVVKDSSGLTLLDGNRRTLRAILQGKLRIPAYVGQASDYYQISNYWVSTPFLRNLVRVAETGSTEDRAAVKRILHTLFKESIIAKINYEQRVLDQSTLAQELYKEIV